jgi:glucose-1-phosphate cytidylyltransferase
VTKVVILCGGQGTRLREETEHRPKPMVDIGGRPILWHIMKHFAQHRLRDFVLCLGYKGHIIKEYFLNYEAMNNDFTVRLGRQPSLQHHGSHQEQDFSVTLADTGQDTMTGGRIRRIAPYLGRSAFFMTYGDGLCDVPLDQLLQFHHSHGKLATLTSVRPFSRYGILDIAPDRQVRSFIEKPQLDGWINAGFCVFEPEVLNYLTGDDCVLEQEPLAQLAREGQLMAFPHEGFFFAMDTYRDYKALNDLWAAGDPPWKTWA